MGRLREIGNKSVINLFICKFSFSKLDKDRILGDEQTYWNIWLDYVNFQIGKRTLPQKLSMKQDSIAGGCVPSACQP